MKNRMMIGLAVMLACAGAVAEEPLDLEVFFRHAEITSINLSPTGDYLATTAPSEDRTGVAVFDIGDYPEIGLLASFELSRNENATGLRWVSEDRLVFTSNRQQGSEARPRPTGRLYAMTADGSEQRLIFGPREDSVTQRRARILHNLPEDERRILIADITHDRQRPMAWYLDVDRYQRTSQAARSPLERGSLAADQDGAVRFAWGEDDDGEQQLAWRPGEDSEWKQFENPFEGEIEFWNFAADGEHVYVKSRDPERMGVYRVHLQSGEHEALLLDDRVEALEPILDASGESLIGAIFNTAPPEARFLDADHPTARIWRGVAASLPDFQVRLTNFTEDEQMAGVRVYSDTEPGIFMLLDLENGQLDEIVPSRGWVPPERMASMQGIEFESRDGLTIHGLLTRPTDAPETELPLVVEVHGGPYGIHDRWGWQPWVQAMASRGFAVLQVNFRGSGGYGHDFEYDAYGQWGREMQDDITDATRWAIEQGIAHPDRICISGASYGGYAALMGVVREPDLYQCAFGFVGVYDLELFTEVGNIPERVPGGEAYLERALGSDPEVLRERSPIHHVENIESDLFIAHGAEDRQAHYSQFHALVEALEEAGIPHEKLFVEGEGHGFYELENNVKLYSKALEFFDRNIGSGWDRDGSEEDSAP